MAAPLAQCPAHVPIHWIFPSLPPQRGQYAQEYCNTDRPCGAWPAHQPYNKGGVLLALNVKGPLLVELTPAHGVSRPGARRLRRPGK